LAAVYIMRDQLENIPRRYPGNSRGVWYCRDVCDDIHCVTAFAHRSGDAVRVVFTDEVTTVDEKQCEHR
jgi:hypothetical protein